MTRELEKALSNAEYKRDELQRQMRELEDELVRAELDVRKAEWALERAEELA